MGLSVSIAYAGSEQYVIYLKNGQTLNGYQLYKSRKDSSVLVAKKGKRRIELKKVDIASYEKISKNNIVQRTNRVIKGSTGQRTGRVIRDNTKYGIWGPYTLKTNVNVTRRYSYNQLKAMKYEEVEDIDAYVSRNEYLRSDDYPHTVRCAELHHRIKYWKRSKDRDGDLTSIEGFVKARSRFMEKCGDFY